MKKSVFFPGRVSVFFGKGPLGFLRQDPSEEAKRIKEDPSLRDQSAPVKQETVKQNALTVVRMRGGDASDETEVLGEYILQFGKYKGKRFRWLLENDVGYTVYLIQSHFKEEAAGVVVAERHSKDSFMSFLHYALSFKEINSLLEYEAQKTAVPTPAAEDDQLVGFGVRASRTWRDVWESRDDGYAAFILRRKCVPGTKMHRLQLYLRKKQEQPSTTTSSVSISPAVSTPTSAEPLAMDDDEELERAMLSISSSGEHMDKSVSAPPPVDAQHQQTSATQSTPSVVEKSGDAALPSKKPVPLPKELVFLLPAEPKNTSVPAQGIPSTTENPASALVVEPPSGERPQNPPPVQPPVQPTAAINRPPPPQLASLNQELNQWNCSHQQRTWMKLELESMGLWPGSRPVSNLMKTFSLWRLPPQPELIDSTSDMPSSKYFQLHPFFIWKPESDNLMGRLRNNYTLPCSGDCAHPHVVSAGVGRPRVIVGITGQYYLLSSRLCCKRCRRRWYADNPLWLEKLPQRFTNLLPALLTYKKAICKSVLDEL